MKACRSEGCTYYSPLINSVLRSFAGSTFSLSLYDAVISVNEAAISCMFQRTARAYGLIKALSHHRARPHILTNISQALRHHFHSISFTALNGSFDGE